MPFALRGVFSTLQTYKMEEFAKIGPKAVDYFRKTLNFRCLTGFWIRRWSLQLTFYANLCKRIYRYFINLFQSMSNRATPELAVKVWLAFVCFIKLWIWSLYSVIHETLTVTLILWKWKLTAYIESSEWLNIGTWLYNVKFGQQIQNHFSGKARLTLNFSKSFFPYWSYL